MTKKWIELSFIDKPNIFRILGWDIQIEDNSIWIDYIQYDNIKSIKIRSNKG